MPFRRHVVPYLSDFAVGADPECHPDDPEKRLPEKTLHAPRAIGLDHLKFRIRKQWKIQLVLYLEFCLRFHGIGARSHDRRICILKFLDCVAKLGRFVRSTRRICLRIKIQDQVFSPKISERHHLAAVVLHFEFGSFVAFFEHVLLSLRPASIDGAIDFSLCAAG